MSIQSKTNSPGPMPCAGEMQQPVQQACAQVKSTELLQGRKAVDIEHNGCLYRLQTTRLGKLILTK